VVSGGNANITESTGDLHLNSSSVIIDSIQTSDIIITQSNLSISAGSTLIVSGNLDSVASQLNLQSGTLHVDGNVVLSNSVLKVSANSIVSISGCVSLNNITFDLDNLDLSNLSQNLTLFTFDDNCTSFENIQLTGYSTSTGCTTTTVSPEVYKEALVIDIIKDTSKCDDTQKDSGDSPGFSSLLAVILSVVVIVVIAIIITAFIVNRRDLRSYILPFREVPPDYFSPTNVE